MTIQELTALAEKIGFEHAGALDPATIELKEEVREMCASGKCAMYDKRWSCPPGCGTLEECAGRLRGFRGGILVQTCGDIEDGFDFEAMMEVAAENDRHFDDFTKALRESGGDFLPMSAGTCTRCAKCTYPDAPCRFPEKRISSLEAYCMNVSKLSEKCGMKYINGQNTVTYFGAVFL